MRCSRSKAPCGSAPRSISTIRPWFATSSPTGAKRRASSRGRPCARCAERWGSPTRERAGAAHPPGTAAATSLDGCARGQRAERARSQSARRTVYRSAAGPVHPARCARGLLRDLRGALRLLALPLRQAELDIPMARLTEQYMEYVEVMRTKNLELAAEYLVMAAMLMEIKSRMLLPRPTMPGRGNRGPRAELVRRLLEYDKMKLAGHKIDALPQLGRDFFPVEAWVEQTLAQRLPQ